ncbi:hypothetical protein M2352_000072 [Azospirillum fermentarium]|uniref:hypothetical protein n=1 Tax=Azospirillum fermentarium TaxID=1233114 RepID=UPI002227E21A|nr:hypothetical protein [Azospirillum fermentarium]MCW2244481.1 hypothetical protein [Azospirillum fermentarium]
MTERLINDGAFALFQIENRVCVSELKKRGDSADAAIAAAFEADKNRYVHKFADLLNSLKASGLSVVRNG